MDLCNTGTEVRCLEALGCRMVHVDVIDGRFSPDMPLGINMIQQLRQKTRLIFDAHLMAADNAPYVELLLAAGVDRLCFHTEFEPRPNILLRKIRSAGCQPGIAISPETPLSQVEHLLPLCDFVLIMRIDAGYAHLPGQGVYPHVDEKIAALSAYCKSHGLDIEIEVDGRVGFEDLVPLAELGVRTFVSGSRGLFSPQGTREQNWKKLTAITEAWREQQ
ncbi:MAG: ribulose-phosphate 3-epimerase [Clostridia bacterium]|nr:ribulose-phosphate 3-epimerase [Clostridia bacterium]